MGRYEERFVELRATKNVSGYSEVGSQKTSLNILELHVGQPSPSTSVWIIVLEGR